MIRNKIVKIYSRLLMYTSKYTWFEKYFKPQVLKISEWYLYPEFRKSNKFIDFVKSHKLLVAMGLVVLLWTTGFFSIGRWMSFTEKKEVISKLEYKLDEANNILYYTNTMLSRKDSTITQLREQMGSRDYLQYIIKRDCNLKHYDNLTQLSDEVFFTMVDEVEKYQIPYTIFFRVVDHESGFKFIPNSQGSGAFGYCQVMPLTFQTISRKLGFSVHNEVNNIKTGAYLLYQGYSTYKSSGFSDKDAWYRSLVDYSGGDPELAASEMKYFKENLVN